MEESLHRSGEELISISELASRLGKAVNSVYSLMNRGRRNLVGEIVRLQVIKTESGWKTSEEAYNRFIDQLNKVKD